MKNYPSPSPLLTTERSSSYSTRESVTKHNCVPNSSNFSFENRWTALGSRESKGTALVLASFIPILLAGTSTVGDDFGGSLAFILCLVLTFSLFGMTSWKNEKPK